MQNRAIRLGILLLLILGSSPLAARSYYLSPSGNDSADARTPATAWRSLGMLDGVDFEPGDTAFLEGGARFAGSLYLDSNDGGTSDAPVVITSHGTGRATIAAGLSFGIYAYNTSGIVVRRLDVVGPDSGTSTKDGIMFYMDAAEGYREFIRIEECSARGFRNGITLGANHATWGFRDVVIRGCDAHGNSRAGISSYGFGSNYTSRRVSVIDCRAYDNPGDPDYTAGHSGNGIVMGGIDTLLIERCIAYGNGALNAHLGGGPCGIWIYLCANGTIQYCESHHNKAGEDADGGGFDIDGGSRDCVIQYCYSHDNEGPGYLLAEYGAEQPFRNNVIRYNISRNDARKNGKGAIIVWGVDADHPVTESRIYNNTIHLDGTNPTAESPWAVMIAGEHVSGVEIMNNIFIADGAGMIWSPALGIGKVRFLNNDHFSSNGTPTYRWGDEAPAGFAAWLAAAEDQERVGTTVMGRNEDPMLVDPASAGTAGSPDALRTACAGYRLRAGSPMIDGGIEPRISPASMDFFGVLFPVGNGLDLGCAEYPGGTTLAVREIAPRSSSSIGIAPNPGSDLVTVACDGLRGPARLSIADALGRVVRSVDVDAPATMLSVAEIPAGIYLLTLTDEQGTRRSGTLAVRR